MQRCPRCDRAFDDDTLTVCLDDGSSLASGRKMPTTQGYTAPGYRGFERVAR
jgi:hypothetical protein